MLSKKLDQFPADEATVLVLLERVSEAQRLAAREAREIEAVKGGKGKKRGGGGDEDEDGDAAVKDVMASAREGMHKKKKSKQ
jgi:hypothetical protein